MRSQWHTPYFLILATLALWSAVDTPNADVEKPNAIFLSTIENPKHAAPYHAYYTHVIATSVHGTAIYQSQTHEPDTPIAYHVGIVYAGCQGIFFLWVYLTQKCEQTLFKLKFWRTILAHPEWGMLTQLRQAPSSLLKSVKRKLIHSLAAPWCAFLLYSYLWPITITVHYSSKPLLNLIHMLSYSIHSLMRSNAPLILLIPQPP